MNGLQANLIVPTSLDTISFFIRDNLFDFDLRCLERTFFLEDLSELIALEMC